MTQIRELWVDGFGCLRAEGEPFRFEADRITLFLDDNEAGKTTLQMALLASLYGLETDKRLLRTSLRPHGTHWYPFSGPPFGTRLRVHDGSRLLEVRWNFEGAGEFRVIDLDTNADVTEDVCPGDDGLALGRRLIDLSIGELTKTCLVCQDDLSSVGRAVGLDSLVQRAADSQAGDATVARAQQVLRGTVRNYPEVVMLKGGALDNEIKRLKEDADGLRHTLAELEREREAIAEADAEFQRLTAERRELRRQEARLDYLAQVAEHDELDARIRAVRETQATVEQYEAEYKKVAHLEGFPAERAADLTRWQVERLELGRQAEQAEKTIAELRTHGIEPAQRDLEHLGRLAAVEQADVDRVTELLGKVRDFETREGELADAVRREEDRLAAEGASIEDHDRLVERFRELEAQDAAFIMDHERAAAQGARELEEAKRRALEAQVQVDRVLETRQREREASQRWVTYGLITAGAGVVVGGLLMIWSVAVGILVLLAGLGACGGLVLKGRRDAAASEVLQAGELDEARKSVGQHEERCEALAAEQHERDARLKQLTRRYGYEQAEVLVDDYSGLDDLRRLCGALIDLRAHSEAMAGQREAIEADVDARLAAYGHERPLGGALSRALDELQDRMGQALRIRQRVDELTRRIAEEQARHEQLREREKDLTARVRAILADGDIADSISIEQGIEEFGERVKHHGRLRQLVDQLIPQQRAHTVDESVVDGWQADLDRIHRAIATLREERPSLVAVEATESANEYRRQRGELRRTLDELDVKTQELGSRVVGVLSRYSEERPARLAQIDERDRQAARARRHRDALALASDVLDEIGHEVHGRWAEELNRSTSHLLERIAPTLSDLKFDSRLHFGVWHQAGDTPVRSTEASPILSAGTWDQLYLAVRLGIADFITQRGAGGLIVLDDPFAHFDDTRFAEAMRILAEFAADRHQIVLFSCQRQRFEWLRTRDPEWFAAHVAPRSIRPAASPPGPETH